MPFLADLWTALELTAPEIVDASGLKSSSARDATTPIQAPSESTAIQPLGSVVGFFGFDTCVHL